MLKNYLIKTKQYIEMKKLIVILLLYTFSALAFAKVDTNIVIANWPQPGSSQPAVGDSGAAQSSQQQSPDNSFRNSETYIKAYSQHLQHMLEIDKLNIQALKQQQLVGSILLFIVTFLTMSGIIFSGWQIAKATNMSELGQNDLEIGTNSLKITTSVVGLAILTISLGYYYFFVKEVYTVKFTPYCSTYIAAEECKQPPKQ